MAMVKIDIDWRSFYVRFFDPSIPSAYAKMYRFSTAAMAWVTGSSPHGRTMAQVYSNPKKLWRVRTPEKIHRGHISWNQHLGKTLELTSFWGMELVFFAYPSKSAQNHWWNALDPMTEPRSTARPSMWGTFFVFQLAMIDHQRGLYNIWAYIYIYMWYMIWYVYTCVYI